MLICTWLMLAQAADHAGAAGEAGAALPPSTVLSDSVCIANAVLASIHLTTNAANAEIAEWRSLTWKLPMTGDLHVRRGESGAAERRTAGGAQSGRVPHLPHIPGVGAGAGGRHERPRPARCGAHLQPALPILAEPPDMPLLVQTAPCRACDASFVMPRPSRGVATPFPTLQLEHDT